MKIARYFLFAVFFANPLLAGDAEVEETLGKHREGSEKVADDQDELSADVQQLAMEQTLAQVIELLNEVEGIMDEATDFLLEPDTGERTIAAQTEIIEKIHQAAKARQDGSGNSQAGGAMMDMLERMMGREPGQNGGENPEAGENPGTGLNGGESDSANDRDGRGSPSDIQEERRVPKAAGRAGRSLPEEFQRVLDAYNRGLEGMGK